MECPKCGYEGQSTAVECPKCGIVYKKWEAHVEKKQDEKRVKRFEKVEKKKHLIIFSVVITGLLIFGGSYFFGPCHELTPMLQYGPATYSYGGQSIKLKDHLMSVYYLGWYRGGHFKPYRQIAAIESGNMKIYAQSDRVIIENKILAQHYTKKCDGATLEQMIINKIEKNR